MLKGGTTGELGVLELLDGVEMLIDERIVGQRPEAFSGLQLWGIGWQKQQVDVLGHSQPDTGMPAGAVKEQHDLLPRARPDLASELHQLDFKERDAHTGR